MDRKRVAILGSTGSIGRQALDVIERHPERFEVAGLAAGRNVELLAQQIEQFRPRVTASAADGPAGLLRVAVDAGADILLAATDGAVAFDAVFAAVDAGIDTAIANKELIVAAGELLFAHARASGARLLPVDSEHSAIFQCVDGEPHERIAGIVLTASGGPFWGRSLDEMRDATVADALKHPTWQMGVKNTIDSATLMNKGLEVIEAHWLFGLPANRIDVLVHPQSVVHSMIELTDGSIIAQLGVTDMKLPIQYAFSYPERWPAPCPPLDLTQAGRLEFDTPHLDAFPCLGLAYRALEPPKSSTAPFSASMPVVLNAANEVAVAAFLAGRLTFTGIPRVIEQTMDAHAPAEVSTLAAVRAVDAWARDRAQAITGGLELRVRT
jgi:1-deoxy-D-xylulose-5-phosphate reductoisomerase